MEKANLKNCLNDPQYRPLGTEARDRLRLKPHRALYSQQSKRLLVLLKRGAGADYSTNTDMLETVSEVLNENRITQAYLVQCDGDDVVAWETILNVKRRINGTTPRQGEYGPYVWLEEHTFNVIGGSSAWSDEELPF